MKRKIVTGLFVIYILVILRLTVFRTNISSQSFFSGTINATLFREYIPLIRNGAWLRSVYLFVGNIVCFIPFGMYLQWIKRPKIRTIVIMGLLFSLFIEIMQYVLGTGISELDDLILNTLGVLIGAMFLRLFLRRIKR